MQPVASGVHASLGNDDMGRWTAAACEEALALGNAGHSGLGPRPPPVLLSAAGRDAAEQSEAGVPAGREGPARAERSELSGRWMWLCVARASSSRAASR